MDSPEHKSKRMHACPFTGCTAVFNRPYRLAQHRLVHINVKAFICTHETCTKEYTSKSHLDRHINNAHKKSDVDILHCCPKCMKKYANRQNLKRHMKVNHIETNKPFSCDICKLIFKKKHQLRAHMYIHNGLKTFRCNICEREFITLYEKKKHMRNHKTYNCEHCDTKFNRWTDLITHKKKDHQSSEYICHDCGRVFKERQHIIKHVKKHVPNAPIKMFYCPYENCHRHYSRNSNLKQHILMKHEGVTFNCSICDVKLSTKAKLNKHIERHCRPDAKLNAKKTSKTARKRRKDANSMKSSSIFKLGGIIHNEVEDPSVSNVNSTNISTCESTSPQTILFTDPPSQELSISKEVSVPEHSSLIIIQQNSLVNPPCENNLICLQDKIFNEEVSEHSDTIVAKENCAAESEQTITIPFYSSSVPSSSVEINMSQDIPQVIV